MDITKKHIMLAPDTPNGMGGFVVDDDLSETNPSANEEPEIKNHLRTLLIFIIVDVSGSMRGERIGAVNTAMRIVTNSIRTRQDVDAAYSIALMKFSDVAEWVTPQPMPVGSFVYTNIEVQPYITNYASAFNELEKKLHRGEFLEAGLKDYYYPMFLFVTDGEPTDRDKYPAALRYLKGNNWFAGGTKYAVAVGDEARTDVVKNTLVEFCGNINNVKYAEDGEKLCELIKKIVVTGSKIASRTNSKGSEHSRNDSSDNGTSSSDNSSSNGLFTEPDPNLWNNAFKVGMKR